MFSSRGKISQLLLLFLFVVPVSTNYKLVNYGFGGGGVSNAGNGGTNYLTGMIGETSTTKLTGGLYNLGPGLIFAEQANVPLAPTFENTATWYNKLHFVVQTAANPSDAIFALAISTDNFAADTRYVQNDGTIGAVLGSEDYQNYTAWGGASGSYVLGLSPNTTYYLKVKAMQGRFTETPYGPTASVATSNPSFTFDIDVSATDSETAPPYTITFSDLIAGTVVDSPTKVWVDFVTNAAAGGYVYVSGANAGLKSLAANNTIAAVTGDLTSLASGFGAQSNSVSGGLTATSPYDLAANNVGVIDTTVRQIYSAAAPVTAGRASFLLKAKSSSTTPAALDYSETLSVIATANF